MSNEIFDRVKRRGLGEGKIAGDFSLFVDVACFVLAFTKRSF